MPWWAAQRVRLAVLLTCLGVAVLSLLGTRTSLLSAVGIGGNASAQGAPTWCVPPGVPEPAEAGIGELRALRAGLIAVIPHPAGGRTEEGVVTPASVWSDEHPRTLSAMRLVDGLWPAGYGVYDWTRDYTVVVEVFVFAELRQARDLFERAGSIHCHRRGSQPPARSPRLARNLTWVNPDDVEQSDVFMLRGRRVYGILDVRNEGVMPLGRQAEASILDHLACRLPRAGCAPGEPPPQSNSCSVRGAPYGMRSIPTLEEQTHARERSGEGCQGP